MNPIEAAKALLKTLKDDPKKVDELTKSLQPTVEPKGFQKSMLDEDFAETFAKAKKDKKGEPWWKNKGGSKSRTQKDYDAAKPDDKASKDAREAHKQNMKVIGKQEGAPAAAVPSPKPIKPKGMPSTKPAPGPGLQMNKEEMEKAKIIAGPGHAAKPGTVLAHLPSPAIGARPNVSGKNPDMGAINAQHKPAAQPANPHPAAAAPMKASAAQRFKSRFLKSENPDKAADAALGEEVERDVEQHMRANKDAERKEGHKFSFDKSMLKEEFAFDKKKA